MKQITLDSGNVEKFCSLTGQAIVCDEQGRALGFFSPLSKATPLNELQLEPDLSDEELQALRKDRTGKALKEILGRLGLLKSYRVFWAPSAQERLERILRDSRFPRELAQVAMKIDRELAATPNEFGESRFDTTRIAFLRPFGLFFDVLDDAQTVIVYHVWRADGKD